MSNTTQRTFVGVAMFIVGVILIGTLMYITVPKKGDIIVINCGLAEISPDFTPAMREECRKVRAENFNKDLQKPK